MLKINKIYKALCNDGSIVLFEIKEILVSLCGITTYKGVFWCDGYKFHESRIDPARYQEIKEANSIEIQQFNNEL